MTLAPHFSRVSFGALALAWSFGCSDEAKVIYPTEPSDSVVTGTGQVSPAGSSPMASPSTPVGGMVAPSPQTTETATPAPSLEPQQPSSPTTPSSPVAPAPGPLYALATTVFAPDDSASTYVTLTNTVDL